MGIPHISGSQYKISYFGNNHLTEDGVVQITKNLSMVSLSQLKLSYNYIRMLGLKIIMGANMKNLQKLHISSYGYEQKIISYMYQNVVINYKNYISKQFQLCNLKKLKLHQQNIGNKHIRILVNCQIVNLQQLIISSCNICDQGVVYLTKGVWPKLKTLAIMKNIIKSKGHQSIGHGHWPQLQSLLFDQVNRGQSLQNWCVSGIEIMSLSLVESPTVRLSNFNLLNEQLSKNVYKTLECRGMLPLRDWNCYYGGGG